VSDTSGLGFVEVADRVHVLRYPSVDVNVTLVVGDGSALVVDTLSTPAQAREMESLARRIIGTAPWTIVNTHHHFDHCFGNATLARSSDPPIWAHMAAIAAMGVPDRARIAAEGYAPVDPDLARELVDVELLLPTNVVRDSSTLDVGGREVSLLFLGRGHTAGDLVVHVLDADALVAGDLVEESGPPAFDDAFPFEWPATLDAILRLCGADTVVVPGHGRPVGPGFVLGQREEQAALAEWIRDAYAAAVPADSAALAAPFGATAALPAVRRGYAELAAPPG
jgi:glyoxylase-like metal-dependent hydrolase (beta-lactamase superfamily II)